MKYLNDYTEEKTEEMLKKYGAFFAFNNHQFDEQKKEGVKYCAMSMGLICPKENAMAILDALHNITTEGVEQDKAENGKEAIIKRELYNHECFYTGSWEGCKDSLGAYGYSDDDIVAVFNAEWSRAQEVV